MVKKTKKPKKKEVVDASITFSWNKDKPLPNVVHTNLTQGYINDVFALAAENLLASDPKYYPLLLSQLQVMYEYMYNSNKTRIN